MADVPACPSLVAVMVALPSAAADTKPLAETLATAAASDDQVTVRPVKTLLFTSFVTADNWLVVPITTFADDGVTTTEATCAMTVSDAVPVIPPLEARTCAVPG